MIAKLEAIRKQYEADDRAFNELYSYLNDARANRDGEQQEREVFSFFVKDGQLIVNSVSRSTSAAKMKAKASRSASKP